MNFFFSSSFSFFQEADDANFSFDDEDEDEDEDEDDDEDDLEDLDDSKLLASIHGSDGGKKEGQRVIDLTDLLLGGDDDDDGDGIVEEEEEEEKWEILSPAIAAIDLEPALKELLQRFKAAPVAGQFLAHLSAAEQKVLADL